MLKEPDPRYDSPWLRVAGYWLMRYAVRGTRFFAQIKPVGLQSFCIYKMLFKNQKCHFWGLYSLNNAIFWEYVPKACIQKPTVYLFRLQQLRSEMEYI